MLIGQTLELCEYVHPLDIHNLYRSCIEESEDHPEEWRGWICHVGEKS